MQRIGCYFTLAGTLWSAMDDKVNTIDPQLELKNFEQAGKILGEIWSGMVMDGYPVIA